MPIKILQIKCFLNVDTLDHSPSAIYNWLCILLNNAMGIQQFCNLEKSISSSSLRNFVQDLYLCAETHVSNVLQTSNFAAQKWAFQYANIWFFMVINWAVTHF